MKLQRFEVPGAPSLSNVLEGDDAFLWMRQGDGLAAWGEAIDVPVEHGPSRFEAAQDALRVAFESVEHEPSNPPVAFASFTFDPSEDGSVISIPSTVMHRRAGRTWAVSGSEPDLAPREVHDHDSHDFRLRYAGSTISEMEWLDAVAGAVKEIGDSELEKVVLARDVHVWSKEPFDLRVLLARLATRFPECYTFACRGLVGATPELLVGRRDRSVTSLVLAGSARRGATEHEDDVIGAGLLASAKDVSEHAPAVGSVVEVLGGFCGDLEVGPPHLLKLANVQHIATRVTGFLEDDLSALQLAGHLHPTAAICGAPTPLALEAIHRFEGMERGRYAGPVGWVDAAGNGEFGIALRCMEIDGTKGRLFAGGGIVSASEPEAELEETRLKFRAVLAALEGAPS